jgi:hypothetical protein
MTIALCVAALICTYLAGRRSLSAGIGVVMCVGYGYGIIRANRLDGYSHLLFDASLLGLYAAQFGQPLRPEERVRLQDLRAWLIVLIGWPVILFLVPTQDVLVELVGLRGNVWMLPCLLLGARLSRDDLYRVALWTTALNIAAGAFAAVQFVVGIESFFPRNAVTEIIYRSGDVAGYTAHRIPSSFSSAHAYGGTMVLTLPLLLGAWIYAPRRKRTITLIAVATIMTALGVFASAARQPVVLLLVVSAAAIASGRVHSRYRVLWVAVALVVAWTVTGQERLQRFLSLRDTDYLSGRIAGSVDLDFIDVARTYPLGNGLGGGGTSIPYFLQSRIRNSVSIENEYARILLEQGIPGVLIWLTFLAWLFTRSHPCEPGAQFSRTLIKVAGAGSFATGLIGVGLLTSIPGTAIMLLSLGWVAVPAKLPDVVPESAAQGAGLVSRMVPQHGVR